MRGRGWWWAAALVLLANAAVWALAAANAAGEPEAVLDLTERELRLPPREAENTALALELVFERRRQEPVGAAQRPAPAVPGWFDRAKLEAVGFDCRLPVTAANAQQYRSQPPRAAYAALEFEGDEWRAQIEAPGGRDPLLDSHLVAIDVDRDPAALRRRHPDRRRVAVVAATVALRFVASPGQPPFLAGRVAAVLPGAVNVPRQWRQTLEAFRADHQPDGASAPLREPRYRATVTWGRHLEPRISAVQPLPPALPD